MRMLAAYQSGDPYLEFAKQAGAMPQDATKESHKAERDQFKACVLAVQYGMGAEALARHIGQPACRARELLRLHQQTYRVFWRWSDGAVVVREVVDRVRLDRIHRKRSQSSFPAQFPHAGKRRRNAAPSLRPGCGARDPRMRSGA